MINVGEIRDPETRQAANLPPLVGEFHDLSTAWRNWADGYMLCERCRGTGNELFSMYKACPDCCGVGHHGKKWTAS